MTKARHVPDDAVRLPFTDGIDCYVWDKGPYKMAYASTYSPIKGIYCEHSLQCSDRHRNGVLFRRELDRIRSKLTELANHVDHDERH